MKTVLAWITVLLAVVGVGIGVEGAAGVSHVSVALSGSPPTTTTAAPKAVSSSISVSIKAVPPHRHLQGIDCSGRSASYAGMNVEVRVVASPAVSDTVTGVKVWYQHHLVYKVTNFGKQLNLPLVGLYPIAVPGTSGAVCIAQFPGYRSPVALVVTGWGCSNGCVVAVAMYPTPSGTYRETSVSLFSEGFSIQRLGGRLLFVGGDSADFECAFTACALSYYPVRLEAFENGALVDVSRRYPARISIDAAIQWRNYLKVYRPRHPNYQYYLQIIDVLLSWVADECRLGNGSQAWHQFQHLVSRTIYSRGEVRRDLVRWGYCTPATLRG